MKKIVQLISSLALCLGMAAGAASASPVTCDGSISISNTGPDSANTVHCTSENNVSVTCNNGIVAENTNVQSATSGNAFTTDNTTGGDSTTGDASNSNSATVNIGTKCATVQAAVTPPPTGGQGGGGTVNAPGGLGGGAVAAAPAAAPAPAPAAGAKGAGGLGASVTALPETGSSAMQDIAVAALVTVAGGLAVSQFGLSTFKRLALK